MVFVFTIAGLFVFANRYLLILTVAEIVLPILLYLLLRIETKYVFPVLSVPHGCVTEEDCSMSLAFTGRMPVIATGIMRVTIEFYNTLYGRSTIQKIEIPSTHTKKEYEMIFHPTACGEEHILCREIVCYDVFGVSSVHMKPLEEQIVIVTPRSVPVQLSEGMLPNGHREGEQFDYSKKGNDTSQVFEVREYQPGDDVRRIHWKLSGKLEKLLVKEPGYSSHYDTIVLFDASLGEAEERLDESVLSGTLDFAISFSGKLLEMQRPHYLGMVLKDTFELKALESLTELVQFIHQSLGITLPVEKGGALAHFHLQNMQNQFSKIIYIVNDEFPAELYHLADEVELTAICITDRQSELRMVERGYSTLMEIPKEELYRQIHYIRV